jgi:hypothetical protein
MSEGLDSDSKSETVMVSRFILLCVDVERNALAAHPFSPLLSP